MRPVAGFEAGKYCGSTAFPEIPKRIEETAKAFPAFAGLSHGRYPKLAETRGPSAWGVGNAAQLAILTLLENTLIPANPLTYSLNPRMAFSFNPSDRADMKSIFILAFLGVSIFANNVFAGFVLSGAMVYKSTNNNGVIAASSYRITTNSSFPVNYTLQINGNVSKGIAIDISTPGEHEFTFQSSVNAPSPNIGLSLFFSSGASYNPDSGDVIGGHLNVFNDSPTTFKTVGANLAIQNYNRVAGSVFAFANGLTTYTLGNYTVQVTGFTLSNDVPAPAGRFKLHVTAVPEPSSAANVGAMSIGLLVRYRRRSAALLSQKR